MKPARRDQQQERVSRRTFLQALATTGIGALMAGCGPPRSTNRAEIAFGPQATPQVILPSPVLPTPAAATQATPLLQSFLALSALLTGVVNLNPALGQLYLQSLQASDEFDLTVDELLTQAGFNAGTPPDSLAALEAAALFTQEASRKLADKITELWYTGVYTNDQGEETVATYADALAWQSLTFTKPMTICGYPRFWSEAWEPVLD
jgi:hypothetical protein